MKDRLESSELTIMRSLNARMSLGEKEKTYYGNLEKGFKGELKFDQWLENLSDDYIVLNDLLFEINNTLFQIDSLVISSNTVYFFEVKNYEGDFFISGDRWYSLSKTEIKNPLLQLKRNASLFRQLLQSLGFNITIESYVIFVNPEFQLFQAPLNQPIIFPNQLNRFSTKLRKKSAELNEESRELAEQLLSLHLSESPYSRLPKYEYDKLKKGVICLNCRGFYSAMIRTNLMCEGCGNKEDYQIAVLRSVREFTQLFPDSKIITRKIYEWCNGIVSNKSIRKILISNYKLIESGTSSYYVEKD
ncbi:nuclease-related domain-containing protein [Sutcliffiella halmapala]|uniref:nuclease-related domain-containing protein n=1 Tax=Sutcliffiella halmapala TaxID=79882 RepID=UPI001F1A5BEC|nr:nuclease-related domain-containing protein [Sutcliffiella halmapala]